MAQVGRISGPLLEANLLRKGFTNNTSQDDLKFRNTNDDPVLLKIDVTNGRVGVDIDTPANQLQISNTWQTTNLIGDTAGPANFEIYGNNINSVSGNIFLDASEHIQLSNLETEQFYISDNYISTKNTNTNIDLVPNGTGTLEVQSNLEVYGSLNATGNITLEGTITFGDVQAQDTVDFNADVNDDIIPDITDTYDLGSSTNRWKEIYTGLLNGQLVTSGTVNVSDIFLESQPGNIIYVAENGLDTNVGGHQTGPLATIQEAIARCDASTSGPIMIFLFPGTYEEVCPLIVPDNVSIVGADIRNVVIKPTVATQDQDIFHLSDSSTVANLTVKDFYYDSINNTGYAFRFAPGAVITNRSPYIQNITVITKGSTVTIDDPRGFESGNAGKGAYINGAELDSASIEASMLFHSATFITPGVDAITMTNGVRVEWLNSFTYFANRGLYALNGLTGRTTYDGSTVNYGAEVRSIGSASVYGNYGAVVDGADTLMYLIQHNFGYIGAGKYSDNDASRAIYSNETVESNGGKIHFVTTDHLGGFRIGDNFWVDFETGNTTINIDTLTINQFNALRVNTAGQTTIIDGAYIETGNFNIVDNLIETYSGDINIASASGKINLQSNTNITGNLNISGNLSYDGVLNISGDEATDSLTFNTEFEQDFNPNLHQTYSLGSFQKRWLLAHLNRVEVGDISIYDNVVETNVSNADLELRASGTGNIYLPESAIISNALTVSGTSTFNDDVSIAGNYTHSGNISQTGNRVISENATIDQILTIGAAAQFEEILVDDNIITTTSSNTNLELRAAGTGIIDLQENVIVSNNLSARDVSVQSNITIAQNITVNDADLGDIKVNNNYITSKSSNANLEIRPNGLGVVVVPNDNVEIANNMSVLGLTSLQGTDIAGTITHIGNTLQTGNVILSGDFTNGNIEINDNVLSTTTSNSDFDLRANGTGQILIPLNNVNLTNNLTVGVNTNLQGTTITGSLLHTGDRTQTGNYTLNGELIVDNVYFEDNFVTTSSGNLALAATGNINVDINDVEITQNLIVSGTTSLQNTSITGTITHSGNRIQTGNYDIAGEITNGNILIEDNFITTTNSNSDLELDAAGTGSVIIPNNDVVISNTLSLEGSTSIQGTQIIGTLTHIGNTTQTGNVTISGNWTNTNILIDDNVITTTQSNSSLELLASGSGSVNVQNNDFRIIQDLTVSGTTDLQNVSMNGLLTHTGNLVQTGNYILNGDFSVSNIIVNDNFITTKTLNSDLILKAPTTVTDFFDAGLSGDSPTETLDGGSSSTTAFSPTLDGGNAFLISGTENPNVVFNDNLVIQNNLTIGGASTFSNLEINGTLAHTGNRIQTGNYSLVGNLSISSLGTDKAFQFDNIKIDGNSLESTLSNSDLELRANGSGIIKFDGNLRINNNLTVSQLTIPEIFVSRDVALETIELSTDVQFFDNVITTTNSNSNLELRANGNGSVFIESLEFNANVIATADSNLNYTPAENLIIDSSKALTLPKGVTADRKLNNGDIRFNTSDNVFEGTSGSGIVTFNGVYSSDRKTSVTAHPTNNTILFSVNNTVVGDVSSTGLTIHGLQIDDINFNSSTIATNVTNSDLELRVDGTGEFVFDNVSITDNTIKNNKTDGVMNIRNTGFGYVKFNATNGIVVPFGTDAERPPTGHPTPVGDTRWNTDDQILEVWDGSQYIVAGGTSAAITPEEFDDLLLEYTLIFG